MSLFRWFPRNNFILRGYRSVFLSSVLILVHVSTELRAFEQYDDRYPKYSVPIYPNEAVMYLNQNPPSQAIKESRNVQVVATSAKSRYFSGETIRLNIDTFYKKYSLRGISINFSDEYKETEIHIKPKIFGVSNESTRYYSEVAAPQVSESTTYIFFVSFDTESGKFNLNIPVEIISKVNKIFGVDKPYKLENDLVVPVVVETDTVGMFRLTSTLFINNVPCARLTQQMYLNNAGRQVVDLKIYGRLVLDKHIFGEVELRDTVLEKIPLAPGDIGGKSESASFIINVPYGVDSFDKTPYNLAR